MKPALVYLSGPITASDGYTTAKNTFDAVAVFRDCLDHGIPAFCPHLTCAYLSLASVPYETWMHYDFAVIDRCTHVLMLPRWETSAGAVREKAYAESRGVPVALSMADLLPFPAATS